MKKYSLLIALVIFIQNNIHAQGLHMGLKAGTDMQKISGKSFADQFNFGYHLGGYVEINFSKKVGIQPEFYYSETRLKTGESFETIYQAANPLSIRLSYLNIPVLLNVKLAEQLVLQIGPKYGVLSNTGLTIRQNAENAIKTGDLSAVAGFTLKISKIRLYARYQIGLNNISELQNQEKWKNQVIHAGLGLQIF
jgi:hypothetical protein